MNTEDTIKHLYNVSDGDRLFISKRFYKKNSDKEFCLYIVHRTTCAVLEFTDGQNKYNPQFVGEIWRDDTSHPGNFAPIIREWTGRNIVWNFEKE